MKLKILYTFDSESKNVCLARPPGLLDVHTATLEDGNEIGVIDLKTCASALTQASPELFGSSNNDYTVYAYDYSEPDTPLAGQGMLSWALASPQTSADFLQGAKMVTGRVTRSLLGLFSRSSAETLEVKLRLTPVPGKTQGEYLESLQAFEAMSNIIGQEFDAQTWTTFIQNNPQILSSKATTSANQLLAVPSPVDRSDLENVQRLLSGDHFPRETGSGQSGSRPGSRAGTPYLSQPLAPTDRRTSSQSRPSSRTSMRGPMHDSHQRRASFTSGYYSGDETFEEGPAKKRAKLTQTAWHGTPEFNIEKQPDSLRVAASTAASVRLHRPTPMNPGNAGPETTEVSNEEEPIRPPTPVPMGSRVPMRRAATVSSGLRRESIVRSSSPQMPPPRVSMDQNTAESSYSPEAHSNMSAGSTPASANIPSSPPMMAITQSNVSSPVLPPLHKADDSGFMSGNFDEFLNDTPLVNFDDGDVPPLNFDSFDTGPSFLGNGPGQGSPDQSQAGVPMALPGPPPNNANQPSRTSANDVTPTQSSGATDTAQQPKGQPPIRPPPRKPVSMVPVNRPASRTGMRSPKLAPAPVPRARQMQEEERLRELRPNIPHSDPAGPSLQRSRTWTGDMSDVPGSDTGLGADFAARERKRRLGKEQTHARLEAAVKTGQVPPFCENCGTIETPAWRKAWSKMFGGGYDLMECSGKDGQFVCKEILEQDDQGHVKLFKAYKLTKGPGDKEDEFASVNLCNSCGLWLQKNKSMRPESRWNKNAKDPNEKRKRPNRPRSQRNASKRNKGPDTSKSDAPTEPASSPPEEGSPEEGGAQASDGEDSGEGGGSSKQESSRENSEPQLPPNDQRTRSKSDGTVPTSRESVKSRTLVQRATLSSPLRHPGSDHHDPIDVDLTPKPLRRQLFSSPTRPTDSGVLAEVSPNIVRRSPRLNKTHNVIGLSAKLKSPQSVSIFAKQKTPLRKDQNADGLDDLFNASDNEDGPHVKTPVRSAQKTLHEEIDPQILTPSQKRLLEIARTPKGRAQITHHPTVQALFADATSDKPDDMTPWTRSFHAILTDAIPPTSSPNGQKLPSFDFPDLPSWKGSNENTPNKENMAQIDFSEYLNSDGPGGNSGHADIDIQELISTDFPMPSSPPLWDGWPEKDQTASQGQQSRRVSPRKKVQTTQVLHVDSGLGSMDMGEVDIDGMAIDQLINQAFELDS
ncbi:MAG: hypothetical protein Q9227_002654 [Pyrenula ochraceoflavens]